MIRDGNEPQAVINSMVDTDHDKSYYFAKKAVISIGRKKQTTALVYAQLSTTFAILDQRRESE